MCNNVTGKVLKGKGFVKKDVWTKELEEGTIILTKDGDSLFFPKFEKKGTSKDSCYDVFHSSGIPGKRITTVEELEVYLDEIKNLI